MSVQYESILASSFRGEDFLKEFLKKNTKLPKNQTKFHKWRNLLTYPETTGHDERVGVSLMEIR